MSPKKPSKTVITTFIDDKERGSATAIFANHLKKESFWFYELLSDIKERWIDKGYPITELIISENKAVYLSLVKASIPYKNAEKKGVLISRDEIIRIAEIFTGRTEEDMQGDSVDFSFFVHGLGDYRINFSEDYSGVALTIRYLLYEIPTFETVGYPSFYREMIANMVTQIPISTPSGEINSGVIDAPGLIIHCGPTGSGKSTAQASEIQFLAECSSSNIVTYENPIERRYSVATASVRQFQIGRDIVAKNKEELREKIISHALRLNPAMIQFQEASDKGDMRMVMDMSLRGHFVLTTIHASNVKEGLTTLLSVCPGEENILATSLKAIVAHKLHVNSKGNVVSIIEVFVPTNTDRISIAKGDVESIIKRMNGTHGAPHPTARSFQDNVKELVKKGTLTPREAGTIIPSQGSKE